MRFDVRELTKAPGARLAGGCALSFSLGGVSVWFVAKRHFKKKFEELSKQEIEEAKQFYSLLNKTEEFADPVKLAEKYTDEENDDPLPGMDDVESVLVKEAVHAVRNYSGLYEPDEDVDPREKKVKEEAEEKIKNVFENSSPVAKDDFDYEEEKAKRNPQEPYIISHDEFFENEHEYDQVEVTYFEGDDVVSDSRDQPIENVDETLGDDNIVRFGYGSKDNNIVYIRNDRIEIDFTVLRSTGKYREEVLGFIEHADKRRGKVRKFKAYDDS